MLLRNVVLAMTHRLICLPVAKMEGKSAPQTPARRTNEHEIANLGQHCLVSFASLLTGLEELGRRQGFESKIP
jgi:hypothetical protein